MLFSTIGQIHVFAWMIGAGLAVGALYSLCALLRRLLGAGFWLSLAIDALFGLCAAVVLFAAALFASYGNLRLYEFFGAVLGSVLFELGVRPPLEWLITAVFRRLKRAFQKIAHYRLIKVIFR